MVDVFHFIEKLYNIRNISIIQRQTNRTVYFGTESISSLAPKFWALIPSKLKSWTRDKCPCRLYKTYVRNIGFT